MKIIVLAVVILSCVSLFACDSRQTGAPAAVFNTPVSSQENLAKRDDPGEANKNKDEDVDSVKEAFEKSGDGFKKAGSEMEKGFKKVGKETKEFFVGEDKDD